MQLLLKGLLVLFVVSATTALQWALWPLVGPSRFIMYYPSIMLVALAGGWQMGIAATFFSLLAAEYFFFPPIKTWGPFFGVEALPLFVFLANGVLVSLVNALLQKKVAQLKILNEHAKIEQERTRLMEALEAEKLQSETIVEQAAESIFLLDENGYILSANREAEKVFGFSKKEFEGQHLHELIHHHHPDGQAYPKEECEMSKAFRSGDKVYEMEGVFFRKNGSKIIVSCANAKITLPSKRLSSVMLVRDITERKKMETELANALAESRAALQVRDEFLSIASHEIKNPLSSLKLQVQIRKRQLHKLGTEAMSLEQLKKNCDEDETQYDRLNHLVDDMMDVTRMSAGRLLIEKEPMDLAEVIKAAVARHSSDHKAAGCSIILDRCESMMGLWDRNRMEQVITNLLSNAIKYGDGTPVRVSLTKNNSSAELRVSDQGRGIAQEDHEKIFEKFGRAGSSGQTKGLGLGLYITKMIVEMHDGSITVESELGKGTTFIVNTPPVAAASPPARSNRRSGINSVSRFVR